MEDSEALLEFKEQGSVIMGSNRNGLVKLGFGLGHIIVFEVDLGLSGSSTK